MGICLDTEQNNEDVESSSGERTRGSTGWARGRATPVTAVFPMQNTSHVKFEPPSVPVVFVLGGPGSGKVTHCDTLMQERRGVVHINMTDLLQQYAIGNGSAKPEPRVTDMQDFGTLSSKTVTEVLMLEMKMAPTARTYLVSGYPRSMRDVAEYSDKIQTISGVILVSWRQRVLERQIEYGARLGHVVLSLARMELGNFYKRVMPVADYFDQSNMLVSINGERNPEEVYKDFRAAVLQILGNAESDGTFNGVPGEIVGIEPAPTALPKTLRTEEAATSIGLVPPVPPALPAMLPRPEIKVQTPPKADTPKTDIIRVRGALTIPPAVFVIGGPGSNKASLCQRVVSQRQGWIHFSLGQRLRALADVGGGPRTDGALARTAVSGGEFAPSSLVSKLVRAAVADASTSGQGLLLDGYPRDLEQMEAFQRDYHMSPRMVLVDCSKLQLGRGRRDDSVAAFRRRLELFRELTLPMLKAIDSQHRLVIVDGDTDTLEVQQEFTKILLEEMEKAEIIAQIPRPNEHQPPRLASDNNNMTATQQFAHAMVRMGGSIANGAVNTGLRNGNIPKGGVPNGNVANGFVGMNMNKIKPSIKSSTKVPTVSELTSEDIRRMYEQSSGEITMNSHM